MCALARSLAQVFAHVVDPENPLQFEDFDSDDDEEDEPPIPQAEIPQGHIPALIEPYMRSLNRASIEP
jgi:hypothetical protein